MINKKNEVEHFASPVLLFFADLIIINAFWLLIALLEKNFDFSLFSSWKVLLILPISCVIFGAVFFAGHVFRIAWSFSSMNDFFRLAFFAAFSLALSHIACIVLKCGIELTNVGYILHFLCVIVGICMVRISVRHYASKIRAEHRLEMLEESQDGIYDFGKTLIVGAGGGAQRLLREIRKEAFFEKCDPVCAVDDNEAKKGFFLAGIPVEGNISEIPFLCKKYDIKTIFLAIPSLSEDRRREILSLCIDTGAKLHTLPTLEEIMTKGESPLLVKKVKIEDLLGREAVKMDLEKVMSYVENKTVLVTGAGGSIGSELCRQLAAHSPKKLIMFDIYENSTYDVLNEIIRHYPELDIEALIGSVRDYDRLEQIFKSRRPDIVYHAAAHKHVPLMETSPNEALKNNVFGTLNTVRAAASAGVGRFVMISTDKAVNPTNVMGATKRMCEMIVQAWNRKSKTEYVAVRFGNVLDSNGSVIPLFEKQISEGGPVTVTHPDIIRYFMTIPEAVSLVLEAGAEASGGEIFVLDMGEPVKIDTLARNMIKLSGFEPDKDIKIVYTGLRPGEKLYEELLMDEEGLRSTQNKLIHIAHPIEFDEEYFFSRLEELEKCVWDDSLPVRKIISELVPTFITLEEANSGKIH